MASIAKLPPYPPTQARRQIPASQLASLNATIASTLPKVLALPPTKRDVKSSRVYVQTYARDASFQVLQALIWESRGGNVTESKDERLISKHTVLLAKRIAGDLDLQTLLDLTIGYSTDKGNKQRLKAVLNAASEAGTSIHESIGKDLVPALTLLLSPQSSSNQAQGLYALRKAAHCILSFLSVSPLAFVRHFAHSKPFILALAQAYDTSLTLIATSYGGLNVLRSTITRSNVEVDDWERIWVDAKVALIDTFHIILKQLIEDMSVAKGRAQGIEAERIFGIVFALLDLPGTLSGPSAESSVPPTPFLNQSLLADYQQSYSLSQTLSSALGHAKEKDARLDVLESALAGLNSGNTPGGRNPGALKIILRSYGMQQGIDNLGTRSRRQQSPSRPNIATSNPVPASSVPTEPPIASSVLNKGKGKASASVDDPELNAKITQILDVLPDLNPGYVRLLLGSERYKGDLEQVLGALLEGSAPSEELLIGEIERREREHTVRDGGSYDLSQRRNVFDDQGMDISRVKIGKANVETTVLEDRSYTSQMKADILRRAEAIFEEEEEEVGAAGEGSGMRREQTSDRFVFNPEDELEEAEAAKVKVTGDGEETDESDAEEDTEGKEEEKMTPELILELAWIRDPKLFDRDAATRRSKGRDQLRKDTGWADEQIEGWKVMLDRNPKMQEKVKQKHEFSGNQRLLSAPVPSQGGQGGQGRQGRGRGERGRGRGGRGGGGGGGRGGNTGGSDANSTRERAFKDKHKASRGNHNRKRGHDKKMARAGAGMPPSS